MISITKVILYLKVKVRFALLVAALFMGNACISQSVNTNSGTNFWFGYTETSDGTSADYVVYITTLKTTNGTVSIPGFSWSTNFTAVPGITTRIVLPPNDVVVTSFTSPVNQAVNVVADSNVSVFAAIEYSERSDNSCILPVSLLGNQYYVMDFSLCQSFSQFMIIAQGCKDSVEIIPSQNITVGGSHPAGVPYTEVLQPGQVLLVQADSDLTGSMVMSLNHSETGVIAGSNWNCVYCAGTANPFYEELFPINTWGENFVFLPTAQAQDQCRVLAEQNGTVVTFFTNSGTNVQTLNAGQYYDTSVIYDTPVYINANKPVSVGRFLQSGECNFYYTTNPTGKGDPSEVIVDANEQMFLDTISFYVSRTPDVDSTYIQIVTRTADKNSVFLDNVNIGAFFSTLIPNPVYSYCSLTILPGSHTLTTTGQGFLAYTCGLGFEDAMAAAAGVYLQEININTTVTNPSTCSANDGTATVTASGIPPFLYLWSNGQTMQTATGLSAGIYTITVTDSDCVPHKASATVNISGHSGYTATVTDTNPGCSHSLGNSTVYPSGGTAPYTYSWSNGETTQTATGLSAGSYTCTVTDNVGCKYFAVTRIINYLPPGIGIAPYNDSVCGVDSAFLHVYGLNTNVYHWSPATGLSCNVCPSPVATPSVTTTYTISGVDSNGCSASATVTIAVLNSPKPVITGKDSICAGYSDTLSVTGGNTYVWGNGSTTTSIIISPVTTKTIAVTAYNGYCPQHDTTFKVYVVSPPVASISPPRDSLCLNDSVLLSAGGGVSYKWSNGKTTTSIWVKPLTTTTYTLQAFIGTCSDSTTVTIYTKPLTTASVSAVNDTVCPHGISMLSATGSGGNVTYKWSNGATTSSINVSDTISTTYTVTVNGECDSVEKLIPVIVEPLPVPVIKGTDKKCPGIKDTLTVSGGNSYVWSNGNTSTTYYTGPINADSTISVIAYNSLGCSDTTHFNITLVTFSVTINPPAGICAGECVTLQAKPGGNIYKWSNGATTDTTTVCPDTNSSYTCNVSNSAGCFARKTTTVQIYTPSLFACCDTTINEGESTTLRANSSTTYIWLPPSGLNCDTCATVIATPSATTTYTITGTDSHGCTDSRVITVKVEVPCFNFTIPNVFTPDISGSLGVNNVFYIKTNNLAAWSILIYDRWGKEMFKSTDPNSYWAGATESGAKAPDGVYYYIINATCQGTNYKQEGFLQLIR